MNDQKEKEDLHKKLESYELREDVWIGFKIVSKGIALIVINILATDYFGGDSELYHATIFLSGIASLSILHSCFSKKKQGKSYDLIKNYTLKTITSKDRVSRKLDHKDYENLAVAQLAKDIKNQQHMSSSVKRNLANLQYDRPFLKRLYGNHKHDSDLNYLENVIEIVREKVDNKKHQMETALALSGRARELPIDMVNYIRDWVNKLEDGNIDVPQEAFLSIIKKP